MDRRDPPPAFVEELGEAFRRLRPQNDLSWNFADCLRRLGEVVGRRVHLAPTRTGRAEEPAVAPGSASARLGRALTGALGGRVEAASRRAVAEAVGPPLGDVQDALEATAGAFQFLAARVEALEVAAARRRAPVEGMPWLVPPPDLTPWTERVVGWTAGVAGEVVVGECGDGALPRALAAAGLRVKAAEPRGTTAWSAAVGGVDVHLGPVAELVASRPSGGIAGLVLAGVVDRSPVEELVDLLGTVADRLASGAPLVVIGSAPAAWGPAALDLLPGRPLHPATWSLLLTRSGFRDVETVAGPGDTPLTYALKALR